MYEIFCLISSKIEEKGTSLIIEKIEDMVKSLNGIVTDKKDLGEKRFAYPIKHEGSGYQAVIYIEISPEELKQLGEKLKTIPEIVRFQILKTKKAKPKEIEKKPREEEKPELSTPIAPTIFDKLDI